MDDLIDIVVESLSDDVRWQGNLFDGERSYLLDLARFKLPSVLTMERTRIYAAFIAVNSAMSEAGDDNREARFRDALLEAGL